MIRVLVADDHALVREGLRQLLDATGDLRVVAEARDGLEALDQVREVRPDVLLLDVRMPGLGGVEALETLAKDGPPPPALMLTTFEDSTSLSRALRAGARGFLTKHVTGDELTSAIRVVAGGGTFFKGLDVAPPPASPQQNFEPLTERELQVLRLICRGLSNKEIAVALGIAEGTVKNQGSVIFAKLGVRDRTRAALRAIELGLVR